MQEGSARGFGLIPPLGLHAKSSASSATAAMHIQLFSVHQRRRRPEHTLCLRGASFAYRSRLEAHVRGALIHIFTIDLL